MTSIGTLFAFVLVCAGVWIMRRRRPDVPRGFTVPALPVVSTLGIITCGAMIYGLGWTNWLRLGVWLLIGLVIYFGYARSHSRCEGVAYGTKDATAGRPATRRPDALAERPAPGAGDAQRGHAGGTPAT
jgi:APA family basic amino acid/polyamine antiporter